MSINEIIGGASNIKTGTNPPFTLEDFLNIYPQFGKNSEGNYNVPLGVLEMYLDIANDCIKKVRWHSKWKMGMCLYIAHFCTLYLQSMVDPNLGAKGIAEASKSQGLDTSISVGDVSVSTDYSVATTDISGYVGWGLTSFGQQFISMARLVGKGGMYIH